jgi:hypothetical protein
MIAAPATADLVIGSRYLHGISVVNWPLRRIVLSTFANAYIRAVTGLGVRDCTAATAAGGARASSIFFPAYNDSGTIASLVVGACMAAPHG